MYTLIALGFVLLLGGPSAAHADGTKGAPPAEAHASNLNLSKSNRNAEAGAQGQAAQGADDAKAAAPATAGHPGSERVRSKKGSGAD